MRKNVANLTSNLVAFAVTFAISFFLSPYIVRTLGVEANGLIGLTTNFLNYASILTIMLSSMTARFVTIELRQGREQAANEYYTASYASNLIGVAILFPLMTLTVINFSNWLDIPSHLETDAAVLAVLLFLNFLLTLVFPRWNVGTFATNNLYLDSLRSMQSVLLRGGIILVLFTLLDPSVVFVGIGTLAAGVFTLAFSGYYKHRLLPNLRIRRSHFHRERVRELMAAGFWNSVNSIGGILSTGFHLLLANLYLGATAMGLLSLAMTVPAMANQLAANLTPVFSPSLAFDYARRDFPSMQRQTERAMSITSMLAMMPIAALLVFGRTFFALWIPGEDSTYLHLTAVAVTAGMLLSSCTGPLQNVFIITNSQREHSIASAAMGILNIAFAILLLRVTELGMWAILIAAATSTSIRVLLFTIPMATRRTRANTATFFKEIARAGGYLAVLSATGLLIAAIHPTNTWVSFLLSVAVMCVVGSGLNLFLLTARADRQLILDAVGKLMHARR